MLTITRERLSLMDRLMHKLGLQYDTDIQLRLNDLLIDDAELFKSEVWNRVCVMLEETIIESKNKVFHHALDINSKEEVVLHTAIAEVCMKVLSLTQQIKKEGVSALANSKQVEKMESEEVSPSGMMLSALSRRNRG